MPFEYRVCHCLDRELKNVTACLFSLTSESHDPDGPWHLLARDQLGEADYRALLTELEAEDHGKVAEPAATYGGPKMTQRRLF